jgi:alkylation response protein AidB-like acyl-CoA dehydrogenase
MNAAGTASASAEVVSLSDEFNSIRRRLLQRSAREVGEQAFARAGAYDEDSAYPTADVAALHESGLITAVLPPEFGGSGLSGSSLSEVLQSIGSGSLPLGGSSRDMSTRSSSCFAMEIAIRSSCLRGKLGKARCLGSGTQTTRTICG